MSYKKVGFLGGRGGFVTPKPPKWSSNILGKVVLYFFWSKKALFNENIGGAFNAPPPVVVRKRLIQSHLTRHGCFLTNQSTVFAGPGQVSLNQPFGVMY